MPSTSGSRPRDSRAASSTTDTLQLVDATNHFDSLSTIDLLELSIHPETSTESRRMINFEVIARRRKYKEQEEEGIIIRERCLAVCDPLRMDQFGGLYRFFVDATRSTPYLHTSSNSPITRQILPQIIFLPDNNFQPHSEPSESTSCSTEVPPPLLHPHPHPSPGNLPTTLPPLRFELSTRDSQPSSPSKSDGYARQAPVPNVTLASGSSVLPPPSIPTIPVRATSQDVIE